MRAVNDDDRSTALASTHGAFCDVDMNIKCALR